MGEIKQSKAQTWCDRVLEEAKKGNVIFMTFDGPMCAKLSEFIEQPTEGLLYDLNRDAATVLTFIDEQKWVNDYAVMQVITALKSRIDELSKEPK